MNPADEPRLRLLNLTSSKRADGLAMTTQAVFKKPRQVVGNSLVFRDATKDDAAFILELRTDPRKAAHLSKTSRELKQQEAWLEKYCLDDQQVYFMILDREDQSVGTVRLYDKVEFSFCWGSWILKEGTPSHYAIESALLVYHFALSLGFEKSHFDVRKANQSVWKFHERFGAKRVAETEQDFIYKIDLASIRLSLEKYIKYLPAGCEILY